MHFQLYSFTALASVATVLFDSAMAASPGLYLCQNARFNEVSNYCNKYAVPWGKCTTITNLFPTDARGVSSAGPDPGNWCTLYANEGCTRAELKLYYPGYFNLADVGWNDRAKSFNCAAL